MPVIVRFPLLCLDNFIPEIVGLESCHRLTHLGLANNNLDKMSGIENLPLQFLNLVNHFSVFVSHPLK